MRHAKCLAGRRLDEVAAQRLARRERHGMHQDVERIPAGLQMRETALDLRIARDIHGEGDVGPEFLRERHHAVGHPFDMRERELRALAMHGLRDTPGDGAIRREPDDERALALQKTHSPPES